MSARWTRCKNGPQGPCGTCAPRGGASRCHGDEAHPENPLLPTHRDRDDLGGEGKGEEDKEDENRT
jgi:hypothetical protein